MSEKHVVIARFTLPMEAQVACGRLTAEGIPAHVSGASGSAAFYGMVGAIELYVPESKYERAEQILLECMEEQQLKMGTEPGPRKEMPIWVCSLCGDAVSIEEMVCAACGTSREAVQPAKSQDLRESRPAQRLDLQHDEPESLAAGVETKFELPTQENFNQGDALASRAMRAALVNLLLSPIICLTICIIGIFGLAWIPFLLVAYWYLLQLLIYGGELSPSGTRKLYLALTLNLLLLAVGCSFIFIVRGYR